MTLYLNTEHYHDPTAGNAIKNTMRRKEMETKNSMLIDGERRRKKLVRLIRSLEMIYI